VKNDLIRRNFFKIVILGNKKVFRAVTEDGGNFSGDRLKGENKIFSSLLIAQNTSEL